MQHHYYGGSVPVAPPTNGMATASLVCGLIGFFACGLTSVLAVIFGHVSLSQIKRTGEGGHGMAVTGLILGYLVSAGWLIFWIFYILDRDVRGERRFHLLTAQPSRGTPATSTPTLDISTVMGVGVSRHALTASPNTSRTTRSAFWSASASSAHDSYSTR